MLSFNEERDRRMIKEIESKQIIERDIETVEKAVNNIIQRIAWCKEMSNEPVELCSIASIQGQLNILNEIESLEEILRLFNINSYEQEDVIFKIRKPK